MEKVVPDFNFTGSHRDFEKAALALFRYQATEVPVYSRFLDLLKVDLQSVNRIQDIPFLPVATFKSHDIIARSLDPGIIFLSSGTTGMARSRHLVSDLELYNRSLMEGFRYFYGDPGQYCILGLLPSYLEQGNSSLVYMVDRLIKASRHPDSGFYLHNYDKLANTLINLDLRGQKALLIGVSYALLDLIEKHTFKLKHTIVLETGGMKGRRKEMIRDELHSVLIAGFGVPVIHSEYGMTELLSQAYSKGHGIFETPPWMKILIRDANDPKAWMPPGRVGGINVIDLANQQSCAFLATQDLGKVYDDGRFEILGRFDHSDLRGCNLLIA